ncbi:MAG: hydroxypyruvate isomerase [Clostridia bacterium]|nr:hydroxypyruvate isomerase [Clostridia bacterium]
MLRFLANLTFLFKEYSFLERFDMAKSIGFTSVEFKFPEPFNIGPVEAQLKKNGLKPYLFNFPVDIQAVGGRGIANNPERQKEFQLGVKQAIEAASQLGVKSINFFCGTRIASYTEEEMWDTLVSNLKYASDELKLHDMKLTIEPLNHYDNPDIFIDSTAKGLMLHKAIGRSNMFVQLDIYHARQEGEDVLEILEKHLPAIGHIQVADHPGRHQPGTGEIEMVKLLNMIEASDYEGFVSLEYIPVSDTRSSLEWFRENGYDLSSD